MGKKHFLILVEEASREVGEDRVTVTQNRDKVVGSPDFDTEDVPELDLQRAVRAYLTAISSRRERVRIERR
jgi:hypothetical protein